MILTLVTKRDSDVNSPYVVVSRAEVQAASAESEEAPVDSGKLGQSTDFSRLVADEKRN